MGDAEEGREARGVGAFADAGAAEEDPLDIPVLNVSLQRKRVLGDDRGRRLEVSFGI